MNKYSLLTVSSLAVLLAAAPAFSADNETVGGYFAGSSEDSDGFLGDVVDVNFGTDMVDANGMLNLNPDNHEVDLKLRWIEGDGVTTRESTVTGKFAVGKIF